MFVKKGSISGLYELVLAGLTEENLEAGVGLSSFDNPVVLKIELAERIYAWEVLVFSLLRHKRICDL